MYDMSAMRDTFTPEQLKTEIDRLSRQRWVDFENGSMEYIPFFPEKPVDKVPEGLDPISEEFFSYYGLKRGTAKCFRWFYNNKPACIL